MRISKSQTLGALIAALIVAKTQTRDFYIAMLEAFFYIPGIAHVWRTLMFDACKDLHQLQKIQVELAAEEAEQPVDPQALECASSVPVVLSEARVRAVKTLEDAYILLSEYERTNVQEVVFTVTDPFYPKVEDGLPEGPDSPYDPQRRIASVRERLGPPSTYPLIPASRCSAFPLALGPQFYAA